MVVAVMGREVWGGRVCGLGGCEVEGVCVVGLGLGPWWGGVGR